MPGQGKRRDREAYFVALWRALSPIATLTIGIDRQRVAGVGCGRSDRGPTCWLG